VSTTAAPTDHRSSARERLLDAANELFYAEGVQTVGIDRIIERAGVAKASLYNLFGSKEALVAAYLASRHDRTTVRLTKAIERVDDPRQKILAVFEAQTQQYEQPDFNGCAFIAASTEAPSGGLVEQAADQFRAWIRAMFTDLAYQAGAPDPVSLGRQLHFIYDGAGLAGRMDHHDPGIAPAAREAVQALLDRAPSTPVSPRETSTGRRRPRTGP
jgi:AcrR family transcriptional regulator